MSTSTSTTTTSSSASSASSASAASAASAAANTANTANTATPTALPPPESKSDSSSTSQPNPKSECCPPFDPSLYNYIDPDNEGRDGRKGREGSKGYKLLQWHNKPFLQEGTWCIYYAPLFYGRAVSRAYEKLTPANATLPQEEALVLADCVSPWYSNLWVASSKDLSKEELDGAEMVHVSGTFLARVFEGPYSDTGKWIEETKGWIVEHKFDLEEEMALMTEGEAGEECRATTKVVDEADLKFYYYCTTCPGCQKVYGKNYVVIFAKLSEN